MPAVASTIRVELDPDTTAALAEWSEREERSKRSHAAYLLRQLALLRKNKPELLQKIGLLAATGR